MEERFELVELPGGLRTLRVAATKQVFHPVIGPVAEAERIHLAGTRLVERVNGLPAGGEFNVWDVGLGAAANALTAVRALQGQPAGAAGRTVRVLSFDRTLAPLEFALRHAAELGFLRGFEAALGELMTGRGEVRLPFPGGGWLEWTLHPGDFRARLADAAPLFPPHAIFFDPYSPAVNPEMWTLGLFRLFHERLSPAAPCLLTTYTRSTAVRVTLLLAGWFVGIGGATGEKDETTVAANDPALLAHPLGRRWLEKVDVSANAAPLRDAAVYSRQPIGAADFEQLRAHPQFR